MTNNEKGISSKVQDLSLNGLDTLRAVAALWVVAGHLGELRPTDDGFFSKLLGIAFNGPAAVILFFVISGLCIHLSTRKGSIELGPFLIRRYIRVCIPLIAAVLMSTMFFGSTKPIDGVLWSLYCELIYYSLYPWLTTLAVRIGWRPIIILAFSAAGLIATFLSYGDYLWSYGLTLTWTLGLPAWLLGVLIAEKLSMSGFAPVGANRIAMWGSMWMISSLIMVLHFHLDVPYKYTLVIFSLFCANFLLWELRASRSDNKINTTLEWAGTWSYSLYLCHPIAIMIMHGTALNKSFIGVFGGLVLAISISLIFYYLIERPSHSLARTLSQHMPRVIKLPTSWVTLKPAA